MSHFLTLVLVDAEEPNPEVRARHLMRPYFDWDMETLQAQCDGFTIGGRYDGAIWGKEQHYNLAPAEYQRRYGLDVVRPEDNVRPVSEIVPGLIPYAVVTPDGAWHDGKGMVTEAWAEHCRRLLQGHADRLAVALDCHC